MLSVEKLKEYGADTETGLMRCMNSEDFYLRMVTMIKDEPNFQVLDEALREKDLKRAFEAAHALKGVAGNLALTPLYEPISEVTELLRGEADADYESFREKIMKAREGLFELFEG